MMQSRSPRQSSRSDSGEKRPYSGSSRGRPGSDARGGGRGGFSRGGKSGGFRRKQNRFNSVFTPGQQAVDYKDVERLGRFLTEKGKIMPRRITGLTAKQQRVLARAIKKARHSGLIAFQAA